MRVINQDALNDFKKDHADSRKPLDRWLIHTEAATWDDIVDVRLTFNSADPVEKDGRKYTVFNIRGNNYRLIAKLNYYFGVVSIIRILTHAEYSKDRWP